MDPGPRLECRLRRTGSPISVSFSSANPIYRPKTRKASVPSESGVWEYKAQSIRLHQPPSLSSLSHPLPSLFCRGTASGRGEQRTRGQARPFNSQVCHFRTTVYIHGRLRQTPSKPSRSLTTGHCRYPFPCDSSKQRCRSIDKVSSSAVPKHCDSFSLLWKSLTFSVSKPAAVQAWA